VSKILKLLNTLRKEEDGAAMAEYVVLLGVIAAAMVTLLANFSGVLQSKFSAVCTALGSTC
jgi:pilus assembly protein Flp/PilA